MDTIDSDRGGYMWQNLGGLGEVTTQICNEWW